MLSTAFVVVLAVFLVQVSDGKRSNAKKDQQEDDSIHNIVKRDIAMKGSDTSESSNKKSGGSKLKPTGSKNSGRAHSEELKKRIKDNGYFSTIGFYISRVFKTAATLANQCAWLPLNLFMTTYYRVVG